MIALDWIYLVVAYTCFLGLVSKYCRNVARRDDR